MKKSLLVLLLFLVALCGIAQAAPTVNCTSPTSGGTYGTSVTFNCSATTTTGTVTGWEVYVGSTLVYNTPGPVTKISTTATGLATGSRSATVKAYDSSGAVGTKAITFTVSASATVTPTCSSPVTGGTYTNPVPFACSATGGIITGWELYDGTNLVTTGWNTTPVTGSYTLTTGSRTIQVKAYNSTGASGIYKATITVNAPTNNPPPPPPGGGGGGGGSTGGGTVTFDQSLTALTNNNTGAADDWNTNASWGWDTWSNEIGKWGHVSDTKLNSWLYPGATTQWYMYIEPWFDQPGFASCPTYNYTNPYGQARSHPGTDGHRCVGFNNNTDAQVSRQIAMMRLAGIVGVNINVYGPEHDSGNYDAVTKRYQRLGALQTPQFQLMLNEDGGGSRICAHGGSWSGTGNMTASVCHDPFFYNAAYSAAELRNTNCSSLPYLDPKTTAVTVSNDAATCFITKHMLSHVAYYYDTYMKQSNYAKTSGGRPIFTWFGDETVSYNSATFGVNGRTAKPDMAWMKTMTAKYFGNPVFLFRQAGGFGKTASDGAYIWTVHEGVDSFTPSTGLYGPFYDTAKSSGKITFGGTNASFDNHEAAWGGASTIHRTCGKTFQYGFDVINSKYNSTTQLPYSEINTFDDFEEGSEIETGIDNCWRISSSTTTNGAPTISGSKMTFTLNAVDPDGTHAERASDATIRTVFKFRIWAANGTTAADGSPTMGLMVDALSPTTSDTTKCWTVTGTSYTIDLSCNTAGLANGTYTFYAEAVGGPFIHNHMSAVSPSYSVTNATVNQPPVGSFDEAVGSNSGTSTIPQSELVHLDGWAADNEDGAPITKVEIWEGTTLLNTMTATAGLNLPRQDVVDAFSRPDWLNSGWEMWLDASTQTLGSHTYTAKAYDSSGHVTVLNAPQTVTIAPAIPTAIVSVDPQSGVAPLLVAVDTTGSTAPSGRTISQRVIQWGDGTQDTLTGTTVTASHTYNVTGTYNLTMTVTDSAGATASTTVTVTVAVSTANSATITSLTDGAFVYSPIRVTATGQVAFGNVTKMRIYVDDVVAFEVSPNISPASVDKYVFASANSNHVITVSVFDGNGNEYKSSVTVFVVTAN